MATKAKESSNTVVGNEKKKTPPSTSQLTTTKRTIKPTTTTTKKIISTTQEKNNSKNLKPTLSFKQPKIETPTKPAPIRRRSLDKPISSSSPTPTTKKQPSPSRLHKALVSPGPRERKVSHITSLNSPVKTTKPISDNAKTKLLGKKATTKIVANVPSSSKDKSVIADTSKVETKHVQELTTQEDAVIKVDNEEEHASHHISPEVVLHENQIVEDSDTDPLQNQVEDEEVISTTSDVEEAEKNPQEKPEEHEEKENNNGNHQEEVDHSEFEGEVAVNEKEENESGSVTEDQKNESNIEEELKEEEEKEVVEGNVSEEVEEAKVEEATQQKAVVGGGKGKKESQVSNDIIEETASKLLEGRKNKVLALAGAFQTVIDHQTK